MEDINGENVKHSRAVTNRVRSPYTTGGSGDSVILLYGVPNISFLLSVRWLAIRCPEALTQAYRDSFCKGASV